MAIASSIPFVVSMENKMASLLAFVLTIMVTVLNASPANGNITCQEALMDVMPCETFLASSGSARPSIACCGGVQKVNSEATTPEIRQTLCQCFKQAAAGISIDPAKLKALPQLCDVSVSVPLDPGVDCSKISF